MEKLKKFYPLIKPLSLLIVLLIIGSYILSIIENIPLTDSIYYTFLLISTVSPYPVKTVTGKIFSAILVLIGLGLILYIVSTITRILMEIRIEETFVIRPKRKSNKGKQTQ